MDLGWEWQISLSIRSEDRVAWESPGDLPKSSFCSLPTHCLWLSRQCDPCTSLVMNSWKGAKGRPDDTGLPFVPGRCSLTLSEPVPKEPGGRDWTKEEKTHAPDYPVLIALNTRSHPNILARGRANVSGSPARLGAQGRDSGIKTQMKNRPSWLTRTIVTARWLWLTGVTEQSVYKPLPDMGGEGKNQTDQIRIAGTGVTCNPEPHPKEESGTQQ